VTESLLYYVVMSFVVVNVVLIPFNVAFRRFVRLDSMYVCIATEQSLVMSLAVTPPRFYLDAVMDCFFQVVADVLLNFFTGCVAACCCFSLCYLVASNHRFRDEDGQLVLDLAQIRRRYLKV
jgi:H+/gluconate symporter-like permease